MPVPSRVRDTTTTAGNGAAVTLDNAPPTAHRSFAALTVGTLVPYVMAARVLNEWEEGFGKRTGTNAFERTTVTDGTNGTSRVAFSAGVKDIFITAHGGYLATVATTENATDVTSLPTLSATAAGDAVLAMRAGALYLLAAAALGSGGTSTPADTTAPSAPTNLASSNVTASGFTVTFTPGTDNVAVARSEWSLDGTSWTALAAGATSLSATGRTASTAYTVRVRTVDTSGNVSTATTLQVTTTAPSGDTTAPTMSGSVSASGVTATTLTMSYTAGTDNVGIARYEVSVDTGAANWVNNGTNLSYTPPAALTPSTQYSLRVRAFDAAGNVSNVLTATASTAAAAAPVDLKFNGNYSTLTTTAAYGAASYVGFSASLYIMDGAGAGIDFSKYDIYFVLSNSSTVAPTPSDAMHATHANTFAAATQVGTNAGLASANSIFAYKDKMPAGTYYMWAIVVNEGAGPSGAPVWTRAYDGMNTGVPVPYTINA